MSCIPLYDRSSKFCNDTHLPIIDLTVSDALGRVSFLLYECFLHLYDQQVRPDFTLSNASNSGFAALFSWKLVAQTSAPIAAISHLIVVDQIYLMSSITINAVPLWSVELWGGYVSSCRLSPLVATHFVYLSMSYFSWADLHCLQSLLTQE